MSIYVEKLDMPEAVYKWYSVIDGGTMYRVADKDNELWLYDEDGVVVEDRQDLIDEVVKYKGGQND